jgi:TRAP-type C4-dicarboxylate transport system substrate-binding protein
MMKAALTFVLASALAPLALSASAQEVTLKAVSAFQEGGDVSRNFERFMAKVNAEGKGVVRVNFIGGPKAMPPFEVGKAVKTGVVDMAYVTGGFYTNVLPEALALNYTSQSGKQQRKSGVWETVNKIWAEKMNVYYLARAVDHTPYHIFLNKKIDKLDLKGLRIRVTPIHHDIAVAMGAIAVTLPPGEVFTALERGLVDGYIWPLLGIFDLGWQEKTKFRVEPGFYNTEDSVLINLDKWKSLSKAQQDFLTRQAIWLEDIGDEYVQFNIAEKKKQEAAGLQPLTFTGAEAEAFVRKANEVAWKSVIDKSPVTGKILKDKLDK